MQKELKEAKNNNKELLEWLKSPEFIEMDKIRLTEAEIAQRAATYHIFWRTYFKKDLGEMINSQLKFMGENVESEAQLLWIRGVLEGMNIVKSYFQEQVNINLDKDAKEQEII